MSEALSVLSEALDLRGALDAPRLLRHLRGMEKPRHLVLLPALQMKPRRDEAIERAIALLRRELAAPWTVTGLARRVALSRPVLARRFTAHTGESPMRYVTRLRMERAAALLDERDETLAAIAAEVGYVSEFAFNRAFKRHHGVAPGAFRRLQRAQPTAFRAAA